ncbi:Gfo/Idh/MocA family protein [Halohasta salina]|uniref:Gfo/Idh/MocA family protein n=1 Tax=Halohasta salina TaxID=2961621 RepID=UPI0020A2732E|nr:Gfo/Idh/MocA family oxidoreductase [Halohasta salina]
MPEEMADPLKVGIVGAGSITENIHAPIVSKMPDLTLSYIADVDPERASELDDYADATIGIEEPDSLPACDIAVLAIPIGVREPYHEEFARRDVPLFVEKPFATSLEEHTHLLDIHETVFCDYMRTCFTSTRQLRTIVQSGVFGPPKRVVMTEQGRVGATGLSPGSYKLDPALSGGGVLMERGCHPLSQLEIVFEGYEKEVQQADVESKEGIDVQMSVDFEFRSDGREIPVEFHTTDLYPIPDKTICVFENTIVAFDQTDPEATVDCYPSASNESFVASLSSDADLQTRFDEIGSRPRLTPPETRLELAPASAWANENIEAFYLRWQQFLSDVHDDTGYGTIIQTAPEVTRLTNEIYDFE